jgi:hypothetical protein
MTCGRDIHQYPTAARLMIKTNTTVNNMSLIFIILRWPVLAPDVLLNRLIFQLVGNCASYNIWNNFPTIWLQKMFNKISRRPMIIRRGFYNGLPVSRS